MTASDRLRASQKKVKPAYLIDTIEELIQERDRMEANWNESFRERMTTLSKISISKFKTPISQL